MPSCECRSIVCERTACRPTPGSQANQRISPDMGMWSFSACTIKKGKSHFREPLRKPFTMRGNISSTNIFPVPKRMFPAPATPSRQTLVKKHDTYRFRRWLHHIKTPSFHDHINTPAPMQALPGQFYTSCNMRSACMTKHGSTFLVVYTTMLQ